MELLIFFAIMLAAAWLLGAGLMPDPPKADWPPRPPTTFEPDTDNPWRGTTWTSDNLTPHTSATGGFDAYIYPLSERDPETMTKATQ